MNEAFDNADFDDEPGYRLQDDSAQSVPLLSVAASWDGHGNDNIASNSTEAVAALHYDWETGEVVARFDRGSMIRLDRSGSRVIARRPSAWVVGSTWGRTGRGGYLLTKSPNDETTSLSRLDTHLHSVWSEPLACEAVLVTTDPFANRVAIADRGGRVTLYSRDGQQFGGFESSEPLSSLLMAPDRPALLGLSCSGSVTEFTTSGRMTWSHTLEGRVSALSISGNGQELFCGNPPFGIRFFSCSGETLRTIAGDAIVTHWATGFFPKQIATATAGGGVQLLRITGEPIAKFPAVGNITALDCNAAGNRLAIGTDRGTIITLEQPVSPN